MQEKKNNLSVAVIVAWLVVACIIILVMVNAMNSSAETSEIANAKTTIEEVSEDPPDKFFIRISVNGVSETLYAGNEPSISSNYLESSSNPYSWSEDIAWGEDVVMITVWGNPTARLLTSSASNIQVKEEDSTTIFILNAKVQDSMVFSYTLTNGEEYSIYFSMK